MDAVMQMQHIHMGAGALGLGLVVPLAARLGEQVQITVVARGRLPALQEHKRYYRKIEPDGTMAEVRISAAFSFEQEDQILSAIMQPEAILLTTALTETGLEDNVKLIERLLSSRVAENKSTPVYVVPCENTLGWRYEQLEQKDFGSNVHFLRCVVDRLCSEPEITDGVVCVRTEDYGSWVIEGNPQTGLLQEALDGVSEIIFVDDLEPQVEMKRWLVNGPHLAVGVMAWRENIPGFANFAASPGGQLFLAGVQAECGDAYASRYEIDQGDLEAFTAIVAKRFSSYPMESSRVVKRLHPDTLEALLRATYDRLVSPARVYQDEFRMCPEYLHWALHTLHELIYRRRYVS